MSANFFELQRYAATGIASAEMTYHDRLKAMMMFPQSYPSTTIIGIPPLSFKANGQPLSAWSISGNSQQNGTPTPDAPVAVQSCGDWDADANSYIIPITCAGQTTPIYLGQTQTVRKIKKLVLDGTETGWRTTGSGAFALTLTAKEMRETICYCTHYIGKVNASIATGECTVNTATDELVVRDGTVSDLSEFKQFLSTQYANGTPVTVWYVLANEQTGTVNEPLAKIGDYADAFASTNTGAPSIQTRKGANTLSVGTTVQPSSMTITT